MAFTSSIFSHIPLNNQRVYSPNFHKPKLPRATVTASLLPKSPPTSTESPWPSSVAALPAATSLTDPERRRRLQSEEAGGGDKWVVGEYHKNSGFQRWRKINGETGDVNREQMDIRHGHSKTDENVLKILNDEGSLEGVSVRGAGCGVGSSAIPLVKEGAFVYASDISAAMVGRG